MGKRSKRSEAKSEKIEEVLEDEEQVEDAEETAKTKEDAQDDAEGKDSDAAAKAAEAEPEAAEKIEEESEPEKELPPPEPDHPDAVAALKDLGARLETNEAGNVWRILFYEDHKDADLAQIHNLHSLKELWVIGSKISKDATEAFKEAFPDVTVYA